MQVPFVDLAAQYLSIKEEIDDTIGDIVSRTAFIGGPALNEFETALAAYCGVSHAVGVANGTDALTIALKCLDIGPGDEVITAANSFVATAEAISNSGAEVRFCDVVAETAMMDLEQVESLITPKTKAIMPVHLYGRMTDMDTVMTIASKHDLRVIEDAAQAHGAAWNGHRAGSLSDAACYSFYPGKNLGAYGDGGAIVTDDDTLARRMRMYKNHGRISKYDHEFIGINSRLDGIQSAVLSVKLPHLDGWNRARFENAQRYNELLSDIEEITCPPLADASGHSMHLYVIQTGRRDKLKEFLATRSIASGIHYPITLPNLTAYSFMGHGPNDFPVSSTLQNRILSLPMFPELTDKQIRHVAQAIHDFYDR
jgi:dTDP-4-amino-4,6-dideoxygalactose transaminase